MFMQMDDDDDDDDDEDDGCKKYRCILSLQKC